jgi:UDP-2-acetamido-3-amino-2,3-dideoxy-glucuronate N-acetyltransferase
LGSGNWGKNLVRNFYELDALRWVCDTNQELLEDLKQSYPGILVTSKYEDVLNDSDVHAVVIATSPGQHYGMVSAALDKGRHVFVEKPLALHYTEGKELARLARGKGLVLMVGHILEYHPAITQLKGLIREGELGQLLYIYSNRLNLGRIRQEENILWSFAPHDISVILNLAEEEPDTVHASGGSYLQPGIVDVTVTDLVFASGLRAHIFVSWLHPFKEQRLVIIADRKMAVFDDTLQQGKLRVHDKGVDWEEGIPIPRNSAEDIIEIEGTEPLRLECQHFLECIREGNEPLTDGESALRVLRILEAGQLSLENGGRPVALTEIG